MKERISVSLERKHVRNLQAIALRYGLSLKELASRVLAEVSTEIPEESISDYRSNRALATSLHRAISEQKRGHVSTKL